MKLLFVTSEAYPLMKTGGLGDVAYGLPLALHEQGVDVRMLLPGYRDLLVRLESARMLGWLELWGAGRLHTVRILEARQTDYPFPLWIVDCPALFDRPGNPYLGPDGLDWPDNGERFTVFARAAAALATDVFGQGWRAGAVHLNDWQAGLVAPLLEDAAQRPKRIFTIHNLAYGGHFPRHLYYLLGLPGEWWHPEGVEFYGGFSMLKAGVVYSDIITTVSPTYAREICTPAFGYGMENLLQSRQYKLFGILNGIDTGTWSPALDRYLPAHYSSSQIEPGKQANKRALLEHFGLKPDQALLEQPLLGAVGRLVEQKGIDMVLAAIPFLLEYTQARFVLVGSGQHNFEHAIRELAQRYPGRVLGFIGYDERLAHLLEAGSDLFLMPSRFEPCGLNQMFSLNYGTLPVVYHTGGLADTVVNATTENVRAGTANGFVFYSPDTQALQGTLLWALQLYENNPLWRQLQLNGMQHDFSWKQSAHRYLELYQ
ncbi:MAG: glycogen synthase GlgA [Thiothrix sp.]|nr:glycogen synthase GlgA [Thiothrix sp.]HPQ95730.1 glycogen synthase GlgA [Thiolinea sp.]